MRRLAVPFAPILTVAEVRDVERAASALGLMERAGAAAAEAAQRLLAGRTGQVVILAGPGNNGGDGFVVARLLRERFHDVVVISRDAPDKRPADAAAAAAAWRASGGDITGALPARAPALVVDALFGIGQRRAAAGWHADAIVWANRHRGAGVPLLALDQPSGLDAQTGSVHPPVIEADATLTFIALKPGLLTGHGPASCGGLACATLGLEDRVEAIARGRALSWGRFAAALPDVLLRRDAATHKGSFGTLAIIGGAAGMLGAVLLAGRAALRCGAGRVRAGFLATDAPAVDFVVPELMLGQASGVLESGADAIVIGCGLGMQAPARSILERALGRDVPLVLDADALNLIAADAALGAQCRARKAATLATPHPMEAARLLQRETDAVNADRLASARTLAERLNACVVLKGQGSVLAHPDGRFAINGTGNPGLASAGSGDVLTGLAGALLAQGIEPWDALSLAVCLHGASADALVASGTGPVGMGAAALPDAARDLINAAARDARGRGGAASPN